MVLLGGCYGVGRHCFVCLGGCYDIARWLLGVARWLLWCCYAVAMVLLGGWLVVTMVLLSGCYGVARWFLWCC